MPPPASWTQSLHHHCWNSRERHAKSSPSRDARRHREVNEALGRRKERIRQSRGRARSARRSGNSQNPATKSPWRPNEEPSRQLDRICRTERWAKSHRQNEIREWPGRHRIRQNTATASQALSGSRAGADFTAEDGTEIHIEPVFCIEEKSRQSSNKPDNLTGTIDKPRMKPAARPQRGNFLEFYSWDEQADSLRDVPAVGRPEKLQRNADTHRMCSKRGDHNKTRPNCRERGWSIKVFYCR